ncbi:PilN domain-containing protein [Methylocystis heyeri]|uniref:Fimbrial assembly protein n=1 Tax=Methylocystis heyeri TaxID=391905 RepID=A0A6B8KEY0_9HYPH|nr:PilN domain-containing protein [Methylocystis heyeri]QGM46179.1 fimbrial assembly protein [Methylocystis heyeri]
MADSIWRKEITTQSLNQALSGFWSWYMAQARAALPPSALAWLMDRGERKLIVRAGRSGISIDVGGEEKGFGAYPGAAPSAKELLGRLSQDGQSVKIILELPRDKFFVRSFEVPVAARASLAQSLPREIERKTLFKLDDIFFGHVVARSPGRPDRLKVTQWILRRDIAQAAVEQADLSLDDLDMVRPEPGSDGANELPEISLKRDANATAWLQKALIGMAAGGLCLIVAGLGVRAWRVDQIGASLDEEIATAEQRAGVVRSIANQATAEGALLTSLRRERENAPSLADLIEETARILPNSAHLTEWRLSEPKPGERSVDLVGLADSAADLPALFDKSPMFVNTTLTAAIMPDLQEKRERFSIQMRVRPKTPAGKK